MTGVFGEKATNKPNLRSALGQAAPELLRGEIRKALLTWKNYNAGTFASFGTSCFGSNGKKTFQDPSGLPNIGEVPAYKVKYGLSKGVTLSFKSRFKTTTRRLARGPCALSCLGEYTQRTQRALGVAIVRLPHSHIP